MLVDQLGKAVPRQQQAAGVLHADHISRARLVVDYGQLAEKVAFLQLRDGCPHPIALDFNFSASLRYEIQSQPGFALPDNLIPFGKLSRDALLRDFLNDFPVQRFEKLQFSDEISIGEQGLFLSSQY